jgi:hypothetical protein
MYERHGYGRRERKTSTGLPIGMLVLSVSAIVVYLVVGGKPFEGNSRDVTVFLPQLQQP